MVTVRKATKEQIINALEETNKHFGGNIIFNRFDASGKNHNVTLKCKSSKGEGARIGFTGRAMNAACWHVYGTFFDAIIEQNKESVIIAMGKKISLGDGNWEDKEVGQGKYYSELCRCDGE